MSSVFVLPFAVGTVLADAGTGATAQSAAQYLQSALAGVEFQQIVEGIVGIAPTILPIMVTILAFKKGLSWCLRLVRRS